MKIEQQINTYHQKIKCFIIITKQVPIKKHCVAKIEIFKHPSNPYNSATLLKMKKKSGCKTFEIYDDVIAAVNSHYAKFHYTNGIELLEERYSVTMFWGIMEYKMVFTN